MKCRKSRKSSVIRASGVWAETIFELFYRSVIKDGGDGAACIACSNIEETSEEFVNWYVASEWNNTESDTFFHPMKITEDYGVRRINFHDDNENFIFSINEALLFDGDLSIVIEGDCENMNGDFTIKKINRDRDKEGKKDE